MMQEILSTIVICGTSVLFLIGCAEANLDQNAAVIVDKLLSEAQPYEYLLGCHSVAKYALNDELDIQHGLLPQRLAEISVSMKMALHENASSNGIDTSAKKFESAPIFERVSLAVDRKSEIAKVIQECNKVYSDVLKEAKLSEVLK